MLSVVAYQRTKIIGQGKFGTVYKGYHKKTHHAVAIKVLELDSKDNEVTDVQQEIQFLAALKNTPNVTHYHGSFLDDTKLWIVMDFCAGGSLRTLLKPGTFEEKYIGVIVREVLLALLAVHKLGVIHRDLKAANILVTKEGLVQLCDFGVAAQLTANALKRTTIAGTPFWMAPEVIREGAQYNARADIWSLGITIYELATGNPPYGDKGAAWAMTMIEKLTPPRLEGREYPAALKECVALCLDENSEERPSADDLQKCRLVKQYKNLPTTVLKELVSRYLLWRDRTRRESVFYTMENELQASNDDIKVQWDFDSLSSKEYIIENDIHIDVDEDEVHDGLWRDAGDETMMVDRTLPYDHHARFNDTLNDVRAQLGSSSIGKHRTYDDTLSGTKTNGTKTNAVPKSLISLFEEEQTTESTQAHSTLSGPSMPFIAFPELLSVASPTIEIPDMDRLAQIGTQPSTTLTISLTTSAQSSHSVVPSLLSVGDSFPKLNKPPALVHSHLAGPAPDLKINSPSGRIRKNTITVNASTPSILLHTLDPLATLTTLVPLPLALVPLNPIPVNLPQGSQTPPYVIENITRETSSPIVKNGSGTANVSVCADPGNTGDGALGSGAASQVGNARVDLASVSPSKFMRALNHGSNPMLQPINFKLNGEGESSGGTTKAPAARTHHPISEKRDKPSLRIQMPVPSTLFNLLSALTNDELDNNKRQNENVNQFGINAALLGNIASMTPVAEKDGPLEDSKESSMFPRQAAKKPLLLLGTKSAPAVPVAAAQVMSPLGTGHVVSTLVAGQMANSLVCGTQGMRLQPIVPNSNDSQVQTVQSQQIPSLNMELNQQIQNSQTNTAMPNLVKQTSQLSLGSLGLGQSLAPIKKFPLLPPFNTELLLDLTTRAKVTREIETLTNLLEQGLDAIEAGLSS